MPVLFTQGSTMKSVFEEEKRRNIHSEEKNSPTKRTLNQKIIVHLRRRRT